jgi:Uma2 family endonuclease
MVQTPSKTMTLEEFLQQPETKPASEYIDGQIIYKPMPQGKHSSVQGELVPAINFVVKPKRIARAFPELRCTFGDRSTVPDITVFVWSRIPRDENMEKLPIHLRSHQIGQLKYYLPTKVKQKSQKIFFIVSNMALKWVG